MLLLYVFLGTKKLGSKNKKNYPQMAKPTELNWYIFDDVIKLLRGNYRISPFIRRSITKVRWWNFLDSSERARASDDTNELLNKFDESCLRYIYDTYQSLFMAYRSAWRQRKSRNKDAVRTIRKSSKLHKLIFRTTEIKLCIILAFRRCLSQRTTHDAVRIYSTR